MYILKPYSFDKKHGNVNMKFNKYLICALFLVLICCIGAASAADAGDDSVAANDTIDEEVTGAVDVSDEVVDDSLGVSEEPALSDGEDVSSNERVIYVGTNGTDGGDGSKENPFTTLALACNNVSGEDKITLNIYNGTYYLGSELKFNTSNLIINGINGVVIKSSNKNYPLEALELTSSSSNFTMNNIIFDASDHTRGISINPKRPDRSKGFLPFYGEANLGIFNNCTFTGFKTTAITGWSFYNSIFSNCIFQSFVGDSSMVVFYDSSQNVETFTYFERCMFSDISSKFFSKFYPDKMDCHFEDCWFGQNSLPSYIGPSAAAVVNPDGTYNNTYIFPVNRYAQMLKEHFIITYLGNNQYEIIGKLIWNGTEDQEGMENFQPMTVTLNSATGDINQTATLVNGNFRAIYASSNSTHKVTATLHDEEIELEFTTVNITTNPVSIYYGEDQNITFNFTQTITANVTVTVSNGSYNKSEKVEVIGKDSLIYTVPDTLKAGAYDVKINLAENNLFGFNTTTLTVSKVSDYTFEVATGDVKVDNNATISITLPDDVTGTVIVKFGNDTKELPANKTMTVNFTNLNATTYSVNVSYSGNDKYVALDKPSSVTVNKADSSLEIEDAAFTYGDVITIPFNVTNANGVTVVVYNKDDEEVATAFSESGIIALDVLPAGEYTLEAKTVVGPNYEWVSKTINLTINKADSSLNISDKEFIYAEDAIISAVTENSTGDVIAKLTDENNNEIAVTVSGDNITLPKLNVGKYTLAVTTNVDDNHNNATKTATITIVKTTLSMNVTVEPIENITVNDNVIISVNLPSDATGLILLEINNIKLFEELTNGKAKFTLSNLTQDNYTVKAKYLGDNNYIESINDTEKFTVLPNDKKTESNNITVVIDGVKYVVPLENGIVNIKTNNASSTDATKATATQMKTSIKASKKSFKAKSKVKKYTITLKSGKTPVKKVQVSIKIGKKTFKAKTNAKGKATFKITKLTKKGKYSAVIKFKGNKAYKASSKKVKITLK